MKPIFVDELLDQLKPHQKTQTGIQLIADNVFSLFEYWYEKNPNRVFLLSPGDEKVEYTFLEFRNCFLEVAHHLKKLDFEKGNRINIVFSNSPEFLFLYFAAFVRGLTVVPINPDLATNEMQYIVSDSESKAVFYDKELSNKIDPLKDEMPSVHFQPLSRLPDYELLSESGVELSSVLEDVSPVDEAVVIYTSGTTGNPKGVVLTHLNFLSDAKALSEWFQFSADTRTLCILPLFHNNGQVVTLLSPLYQGGSAVMVRGKASLMSFWGLVEKYEVHWTSVMPSILSILLSIPMKRKDQTMKGIICGGQILTRNVQNEFESRFEVPVFEGFGLTETTSFSCFNDYPASKRRGGSVGRALPVNEMKIVDDQGNDLPFGEEGEIAIRGLNVANEYYRLSERNAVSFRNGWFHTGDFGSIDEEGYLTFRTRKDFLIIKGGENIYPAELENVLFSHTSVAEAAVIGVPDKLMGEEIVAFVKLSEGLSTNEAELKAYCSGKIAKFKQAKRIFIVDELEGLGEIPKGPTKKVLYRVLCQYYGEHLSVKGA